MAKKKSKKKNSGKKKTEDIPFYKDVWNGGIIFLTAFVFLFMNFFPIFLEFFPAISTILVILAIQGENVTEALLVLYLLFLIAFIFVKAKKYNGKGKSK